MPGWHSSTVPALSPIPLNQASLCASLQLSAAPVKAPSLGWSPLPTPHPIPSLPVMKLTPKTMAAGGLVYFTMSVGTYLYLRSTKPPPTCTCQLPAQEKDEEEDVFDRIGKQRSSCGLLPSVLTVFTSTWSRLEGASAAACTIWLAVRTMECTVLQTHALCVLLQPMCMTER